MLIINRHLTILTVGNDRNDRKEEIKNIMAIQFSGTSSAPRRGVNPRILVQMPVQATWTDANTGEVISVNGMTENVGTNSVLVNFDNLPPVGGEVRLKMLDEETMLLETDARVIRVERDPGKPLAALNVIDNVQEWQERVFTAAQEVAARTYANDEDEWIN
jgi:hypothetical protein